MLRGNKISWERNIKPKWMKTRRTILALLKQNHRIGFPPYIEARIHDENVIQYLTSQ